MFLDVKSVSARIFFGHCDSTQSLPFGFQHIISSFSGFLTDWFFMALKSSGQGLMSGFMVAEGT